MKSTELTIGAVARRFGLATHVLRHWESVGLLHPARVGGEQRRYGPDDVYRVAVILRAKQAGLSLPDIRDLLTTGRPAARKEILRRHRAELAARIAAVQASLDLIDVALDCTHDDLVRCPHFRASLAEPAEVGGGIDVEALFR